MRTILKTRCPENLEDWWVLVNESLSNFTAIVGMFARGEDMWTIPGKVLSSTEAFLYAVAEKNHERAHLILQNSWGNAPDTPGLDNIKGWDELCTVLSEYGTWEEPHE